VLEGGSAGYRAITRLCAMSRAANESRKRTAYGLGHDFVRTLAFFAFFQLRAFGAEPIQ
jgi:hypothetical protein